MRTHFTLFSASDKLLCILLLRYQRYVRRCFKVHYQGRYRAVRGSGLKPVVETALPPSAVAQVQYPPATCSYSIMTAVGHPNALLEVVCLSQMVSKPSHRLVSLPRLSDVVSGADG